MTDDENRTTANKLVEVLGNAVDATGQFVEGGVVPQLLLGPAGKALSEFVGIGISTVGPAAWGIPKAWLDSKSQQITDDKEARSRISAAVASVAADRAAQDPGIVDRGLSRWAGHLLRDQERRESIARIAYRELEEDPPDPNVGEIDEDWMSVFEQQASRASSEKLQHSFAQILAGEIRAPGTVSLMTLQFLNIIDQRIATAMAKLMPWALDRLLLPRGHVRDHPNEHRMLSDAGLVGQSWRKELAVGDSGILPVLMGSQGGLVLEGKPGSKVELQGWALSRVGAELLKVLSFPADAGAVRALAEEIGRRQDFHRVYEIPSQGHTDGVDLEVLWEREPG